MANVNDIRDMSSQVERQKELLRESVEAGDVDERDAKAIRECLQRLRRTEWAAESTRRDRLSQLRLSAERSEKPLVDFVSESDVDAVLDAHEDAGAKSAAAQRGHASAIKSLFEFLDGHSNYDAYEWWDSIKLPERNDDRKDPADMLDEGDVAALREHAEHPRDKFYMEFLADTGLRAAAASQLRVGDITLEGSEPSFSPNAQATGQKGLEDHEMGRFPLHDSIWFLRTWLNSYHPEAPSPPDDAPLWPVLRGYDEDNRAECAAHPKTLQDQIDIAAERAGVEKPVNLHGFRHACVKRLKLKYEFDWDEIRDRVAWSDASVSEMAQRYGRLGQEERLARLYKKYGVTDPDEEEEDPTTECINCGFEISRTWSICPECHAHQDAEPSLIREGYREAEDLDTLQKLQILDDILDDPDIEAYIEQRQESG